MPPKKGVKVTLDKQRTLRFTTRALIAVEDETGWTFGEAAERMQNGSFKAIVAMVWAGLLHADDTLTMDDVADMIDSSDITSVGEAMSEALIEHLGGDEGKAEAATTGKG